MSGGRSGSWHSSARSCRPSRSPSSPRAGSAPGGPWPQPSRPAPRQYGWARGSSLRRRRGPIPRTSTGSSPPKRRTRSSPRRSPRIGRTRPIASCGPASRRSIDSGERLSARPRSRGLRTSGWPCTRGIRSSPTQDDGGDRRDAPMGRGVRRWSEGRPKGGRDCPGVGGRSRTILAALGNVNRSPGMSRGDSRGESRFLVCLHRGPKYPGFHAEPRMELGPKLKELRTNRILTLGTVSLFVDPPLFVVFFALVVILQPPSDSAGLLVFIAAQKLAFLGVMMLLIVAGLLLVPVLITFYLTLRNVSRALLLTAVALGAVSIAFHFVGVSGSLSFVGLSDSYSAATSGMARAAYLASAAATQQFNQTASIIDNLSSSVASLLIGF